MNTTPTPRTESFIDKQLTEWPRWDWQDHASAYADFARQLERELADAKARTERLTDHYECKMNTPERVSVIESELAALRRDRERLDWLENSNGVVRFFPSLDESYWKAEGETGKSARDAIDAAIAQEERT